MTETPTSPPNRNERPGLPVLPPLMALVEILLLMVVPGALDYFWTGFPSLAETQPHFFWLPVLLLSLQYGTVSGLLAAGVAITISALLGFPDQEVGENHFNYLLRIWAQPVLWLLAALVLGQFRMRQIERKLELAREVAELSSQRTAIADHAKNLRARCETLEREIAGRREPNARVLLGLLGKLHAGGPAAAAAFAATFKLVLGQCAASVYKRDGDRFRLVATHGTKEGRAEVIPLHDPLARIVAGEGRALSVLHPGEESLFAGDGLAAVPVVSGAGNIIGILRLDAVEAKEFDEGALACLAAIAGQIAPLIETGGIKALSVPVAGTAVSQGAGGVPTARPRLWRQVKWQRPAARTGARAQSATRSGS